MKLFVVMAILIAVGLHESAARSKRPPKPQVSVNDMCGKVRCPDGKVCRVIEKCGRKRKTQTKCLPCVPEGVDEVCNENSFMRAVLGGSPRNLQPLRCHLDDVPNKFQCPLGSECVSDPTTPGLGICCYGRVNIFYGPYEQIASGDKYCSKCKPPCREGFSCQKDIYCGQLVSVCKPAEKPGFCPDHDEPHQCPEEEAIQECVHDDNCEGGMKCCSAACGGLSCQYPMIIDYFKK